jgi:hypothetical protein
MDNAPESVAKSSKNHQFGAFAQEFLVDLDFVHDIQVAIYIFFCVKDFAAFWAHVLSRFSLRCALAFGYLTQFLSL